MNDKERLDLAEWAMKYALKSGATEAAVQVRSDRRIEVEVRDGKIDRLFEAQQHGLDAEIYVDKRFWANSTNDLRKDELAKFIDDSVAGTRYLARDEFRSLPDPRYDPSYEKIQTQDRVKTAQAIEAAARSASDKIVSATGSYSDAHNETVRVHSNGFMGGSRSTMFDAGADVTVKDDSGSRPDDWSSATTRFRKDLLSPTALGKEAAQRALAKLGQKKIESGQYLCIVENRTARRLFRMLQEPLGGRALQQKSSFLDGMMHKQVGSDKLTMIDDPTVEKGLGSRFFDSQGLAAKQMPIFEQGYLRNYYIDLYYGRKLGIEPTTGGPSNVVFGLGTRSLEAMLKDIKRGILVQGFIGGNSNSTTGDFSMGISGQLIEDGAPVMPIHEMNISGNARELLGHLVEVGNDPHVFSSMMAPSLVFEGVHFSGV
jgi:PmbA protein